MGIKSSLLTGIACGLLISATVPADEIVHSNLIEAVQEKWVSDLDGMLEKRRIRVLVVYNKTMYFIDGADQRGMTFDLMGEFEKFVNDNSDTKGIPVNLVFIPVTRDQLLPALVEGRGDIAAANLTATPERSRIVDFSDPVLTGVKELLITGTAVEEEPKGLEDLAGRILHVRPSSSYFESLQRINREFAERGLEPIELVEADENLEDSDLLEMVNAGIIEMVVVDSHKARFWKDVFSDITVHENIAVSTDGEIAWAIRKDSPKLEQIINQFVKAHKKGTLIGNLIYKRYLKDNQWIKNPVNEKEVEKFREVVSFLRKYADQYEFDWLMLGALAYQESGLDQSKRSNAGAVGIMQLLPSTAADPNVGITNIELVEHNINAGSKYLRFLKERYFADPGIDDLNRTLLSFASYNAGPGRITRLRTEALERGLDPNIWFDNVEAIAAQRIGRETVSYVSNIYKYYVAYRLYVDRLDVRESLGIEE